VTARNRGSWATEPICDSLCRCVSLPLSSHVSLCLRVSLSSPSLPLSLCTLPLLSGHTTREPLSHARPD
jgi:hypothetical protein